MYCESHDKTELVHLFLPRVVSRDTRALRYLGILSYYQKPLEIFSDRSGPVQANKFQANFVSFVWYAFIACDFLRVIICLNSFVFWLPVKTVLVLCCCKVNNFSMFIKVQSRSNLTSQAFYANTKRTTWFTDPTSDIFC